MYRWKANEADDLPKRLSRIDLFNDAFPTV